MAIPRPSETWDVVSVLDPAINRTTPEAKAAFDKYVVERDFALLAPALRPDVQATVFTLRPLGTRCVMRFLREARSVASLQERAFRASVIGVKGHRGLYGDSAPVDFTPKRYTEALRNATDRDLFDLFDDEEMDGFNAAIITDIGEAAATRAFFLPPTWPLFALPDISLRTLEMQTLRRAAPGSGTQQETKPGSEPAAPPPTSP